MLPASGAACFPETHIHATSAEDDLFYLREKVEAGAAFLITQLFFDNGLYFDFVRRARDVGIEVPIVPGIMPITNVKQLERITSLCGASIPSRLRRELHQRRDQPEAVHDFGVAYATMQCAELLSQGAPGIHFYTLNRSPATRAILSALKLLRPWQSGVYGTSSMSRPLGDAPARRRRARSARRPSRSAGRSRCPRRRGTSASGARRPSFFSSRAKTSAPSSIT